METETYTVDEKSEQKKKLFVTKVAQMYIIVGMWLVIAFFRFEDLTNHPVIFIGAGVLASLIIHWLIQLWNTWQTHKR